jgi:hypothetical protein
MSRASFFIVATAAAVAVLPSSLVAQSAAPRMSALSPASAMLLARPESSAYGVKMQPVAPAASFDADSDDDHQSVAGRILRSALGVGVGAAVGGWLGYFGAQVTNSDWARISDDKKTSLRQGYTRIGVGIGAVTGYFLRPKPHASRLPGPYNIPARTGRLLLASSELRRSIATNALEAIEMGRPEWIQQQRKDEAARGSATNGPVESTSLVVYVGDEKVGAIETLRDIAIPEISELRFYDARDARRRWGTNHKYGAIEVVPANASVTAGEETPVGQ